MKSSINVNAVNQYGETVEIEDELTMK